MAAEAYADPMRFLVVLLALPLLSSCKLLQTPGRTLQAVGRTFGLAQNETPPNQEAGTRSLEIALKQGE